MRHCTARWLGRALAAGLLVAVAGLVACRRATPPGATGAGSPPPPTGQGAQTNSVTVYFPAKSLKYLEAEAVDVPVAPGDPVKLVTCAVEALLLGPMEPAHTRVLPKGVVVNQVSVAGQVATVDLSRSFQTEFKGGSNVAALAVWSLVNTVTAVPGIKQVRILFDGQAAGTFAGAIDLSKPLEADPKLLGGEKLAP